MTSFGQDTLTIPTYKPGRYATGWLTLGQRLYNRLRTKKGQLRGGPDELDFGLDLAGMIGAANTPELTAAMPSRIENELGPRKEPQVKSVRAVVVPNTSRGQTTWTITIEVQSAVGPFRLVLAVSGVTVELLGMEAL